MKKKGQVFSLDFMISLIIIILGLGLVIQFAEVKSYDIKDEELFNELKRVGETAGNLIVSNPNTICELVDESGKKIGYLNNCLTSIFIPPGSGLDESRAIILRNLDKGKAILKKDIGISDNYKCLIEDDLDFGNPNVKIYSVDCKDSLPNNIENYYSATRKIVAIKYVVSGSGPPNAEGVSTIKKSELFDCMDQNPNCKLVDGTITIKVWKA